MFLHVLGDALGNVGVIASGLVIWFCKGHWRFYVSCCSASRAALSKLTLPLVRLVNPQSDPLISFFITVIIFSSALPLGSSISFHRSFWRETDFLRVLSSPQSNPPRSSSFKPSPAPSRSTTFESPSRMFLESSPFTRFVFQPARLLSTIILS